MTTGTALITLDQMDPSEAKLLHLEVKGRGRGELTKFIKYETDHSKNQYYYRMRKMGVMPFKGSSQNVLEFKSRRNVTPEQSRIDQLEFELQQLKQMFGQMSVSPAERAINLLSQVGADIDVRSRKFLGSIVAKDYQTLTQKQQKWMTDLEGRYLK
jgi:hypothetical protein